LGAIRAVSTESTKPNLSFSFHAISLKTRSNAVVYRYRLVPKHDDWRTTSENEVQYATPAVGSYEFQIQAVDRDLSYSPVEMIQVSVTPPYFQIALRAGLVAAILATFVLAWLYVRRSRATQVELERRVDDRTRELLAEESRRRKVEDQLRHAKKMDALGTLATGISHDFNNSLFAISAEAELALAANRDELVSEYLDGIVSSASRAKKITNALLTFGRKGKSERKVERFLSLVEDSIEIARKGLTAAIEITVHSNLQEDLYCDVDSDQLQQVFLNLCLNSRDAMPDGGSIAVTVSERSDEDGKLVCVDFQDSGVGISRDVLERINEPFFTTKSRGKGTGLGLSIVDGIVRDHGGTISVSSEQRKGTCVYFEIPTCPASSSGEECGETVVGDAAGQAEFDEAPKILLAEDDAQICELVARTLVADGFEVIQAKDGAETWEAFEKNADEIALAIVDIDMPIRDGLSCVRDMRECRPNLPTILSSGLVVPAAEELECESFVILQKPFPLSTLRSTVQRLLELTLDGAV
ncbi:MAG: ATP-binding protein, partial [Planctomycetota bacterium]